MPLAARPIAGVLFVQLNTAPAGVPLKVTAVVVLSLHSSWLPTAFTVGVVLTVMVNVKADPVQVTEEPVKVGVTVMVAEMAAPPALVGVNVGRLPEPLAARPMAVLLLVQVKVVPVTLLPKAGGVTEMPLQYTWLAMVTVGIGFTVMVNVCGVPVQVVPPLVYEGVTVMVATTGALPVLVAVNEAMLPLPLAARPMLGALLVQLYTVPVTVPLKLMAAVAVPLQRTWLATAFTVGVGFTVMVNVCAAPVQVRPALVYEGVTVMVAVTGVVPVLVAVNEAMLPLPLAARPMPVLLFVQLYTVLATAPVKLTAVVAAALHTTWSAGSATVGVGFTVMVKVVEAPVQVTPFAVNEGVTVKVLVSGALVALAAVNAGMLPVPLVAAKPMASPVRVQAYSAPGVLPVNVVAATLPPGQCTWLLTLFTVGIGFTFTVAD